MTILWLKFGTERSYGMDMAYVTTARRAGHYCVESDSVCLCRWTRSCGLAHRCTDRVRVSLAGGPGHSSFVGPYISSGAGWVIGLVVFLATAILATLVISVAFLRYYLLFGLTYVAGAVTARTHHSSHEVLSIAGWC
ncbi:amy [Symbiodinium sp. KB8]|nr:amy [Symbiodinium sp. KB8]